jgi:nucleotide-binding universal stress UspA family protein
MNNRGFKRIVLATDGSDQAEAARHVAAALAETSRVGITADSQLMRSEAGTCKRRILVAEKGPA